MSFLSSTATYLADFFRMQEEAAVSQATPPVMTPLDMPHAFVASYTQLPTCIDVDVPALCIHSASHYHKADTYAATKLTVSGTAKDCDAANTTELLAALNAMAPGNYIMHVNIGLATHKDFQSEDSTITKAERIKSLRLALACMMMARETMAPSGRYHQKHSPSLKLDMFPAGVFSLHGVNTKELIASGKPAPKGKQASTPSPELAQLHQQVKFLTDQVASGQARAGTSMHSDYGARSEHAAKRPRTATDQRTYEQAMKAGVMNSFGEIELDIVMAHSSPTRMPAALELRMVQGSFGFHLASVKKAVAKQAHGNHNHNDDSRTLKLDSSADPDPTDHQFLAWPDCQNCLKMFVASWLHRFGSNRQAYALSQYEETLRKLQLRWPERPTAAAEMDYWYRSNAANGIARFGSINAGPDDSRVLPDWKLKDAYELKVLGVPAQQTLPFCSWCNSHHLPGTCQRRAPPTPIPDKLSSSGLRPTGTDLFGDKSKKGTQPICFAWNKGKCEGPCKYQHKCAVCNEDHTALVCVATGGGAAGKPGKDE